jgi:hypothetical protein
MHDQTDRLPAAIGAHAKRMGLKPEQLSEALLSYAAAELSAWATDEEEADPGCVWHTGDAPLWLEPYLPAACGSRSTTEPASDGFTEGVGGSTPFVRCDDAHDAASDAISVIEARLAARGIQLAPGCADDIKAAMAAALEGAEVEGIFY